MRESKNEAQPAYSSKGVESSLADIAEIISGCTSSLSRRRKRLASGACC